MAGLFGGTSARVSGGRGRGRCDHGGDGPRPAMPPSSYSITRRLRLRRVRPLRWTSLSSLRVAARLQHVSPVRRYLESALGRP
jgi:hypothetical protein